MSDQLKPPVEREVSEELAFHLEMQTRDLVAKGMDPATARAAALAKMGDVAAMRQRLTRLGRERDRVRRRSEWWRELWHDVRFGVRMLARQPSFAVMALGTLALGIGATTAIFSVLNAVVLRPLPVPNPKELVVVSEAQWGGFGGNVSVGNYADLVRDQQVFLGLAATWTANYILTGSGEPERLVGGRVTASYFDVFQVAPRDGRVFRADEDEPGQGPVVVLSSRLVDRRFGGDRSIVGKTLVLNGVPHLVIGVMPAEFDFFSDSEELWTPAAFSGVEKAAHDGHFLLVYGRLAAGLSPVQAAARIAPIATRLREQYPNENNNLQLGVTPLMRVVVGDTATRIAVLFGAVVLVLLIGCVNVANLLLARGASRTRELAVRAALGAGRGRIVRQLFVENLTLAMGAATLGLMVAAVAVKLIVAAAPSNVPRLERARLDVASVGFAMAIGIVSSLAFGLVPALRTAGGGPFAALREGSRGTSGSSKDWLKRGLVAVEVGLSMLLLVGAGLLIRTAINLGRVDPGFDPHGLLTARISLPRAEYESWEKVTATFTRLAEQLGRQPGVVAAGLSSQVPMGPGGGSNGLIPEGMALDAKNAINTRLRLITPEYLGAMRIPLKAGRFFTDQDVIGRPYVTIINESLAQAAFPGQNPIGKRLACCQDAPAAWKEVVGVVADVRAVGISEEAPKEFYLPVAQAPPDAWNWVARTLTVAIRVGGAPELAAATLRATVKSIDPALPVFQVATMNERIARSMAESRFNTQLLTTLGATGLALAAVGIYGLIAFMVARRTREIGIRAALGASRQTIRWLIVKDGMAPVAIGIMVGTALSLGSARLLASQLRGVSAHDPLTILVVALGLVAVAVVAMLAPAAAAVRVDPTIAMRDD